MKGFWKTVLAVIVAFIIYGVIKTIMWVSMIIGLAAGSDSKTGDVVMPRDAILKIDMSSLVLQEQGGDMVSSLLSGGSMAAPVGIYDAVRALDAAAADPDVRCIYLKTDNASAGMAHLEELRKALQKFHESGKPIISYIESPTTGSYYLASVADKVYMGDIRGGGSMITGVGTQMFFLKDLLDKFGVNVQLIRHGKYKSAGEMYIRSTPSEENKEQYREMISSLWNSLAAPMAESRGKTPEYISSLVDSLALNNASDMLSHGLVDSLVSRDALKDRLKVMAGKSSFKDVRLMPFDKYVSLRIKPDKKIKQKIAVVYADGQIVEGQPSGFSTSPMVSGDTYAEILEDLRDDDDVKAVVLRVASPGGSVTASDKIRRALDALKKEKPVIASYGDYAASGGYWISSSCDKIFSDATTLTGSIGVFSMIPDFSKTASDVAHVGVYSAGSSPHSDMYSLTRPLSESETAYMQKSVEDIYDSFVSLVADGRKLDKAFVDSIAQGRVWSGTDALRLGLVDEIGTLRDAVSYAASFCGDPTLAHWRVVGYPSVDPMKSILSMVGMEEDDYNTIKAALRGRKTKADPFGYVEAAFKDWDFACSERFYARMPYEIIVK